LKIEEDLTKKIHKTKMQGQGLENGPNEPTSTKASSIESPL
jgi:hypothetical protein